MTKQVLVVFNDFMNEKIDDSDVTEIIVSTSGILLKFNQLQLNAVVPKIIDFLHHELIVFLVTNYNG